MIAITTVSTAKFHDAEELVAVMQTLIADAKSLDRHAVVYVHGYSSFTGLARLIEEPLSDGSLVYNIILDQ